MLPAVEGACGALRLQATRVDGAWALSSEIVTLAPEGAAFARSELAV